MKIFCAALCFALPVPAFSAPSAARAPESALEATAVFDGVEVYAPVRRGRSLPERLRRAVSQTREFLIPETVRVQIFPHHGPYSSPQGRETIVSQVRFEADGSCTLHSSKGTLLLTEQAFTFDVTTLEEPKWLRCEGPVRLVREKGLESLRYQGTFEIKPGATPQGVPAVRVIQHISFEEYLKGVVPAEMPATWPMESLKAQAIAARTYGLHQMMAYMVEIQDYDVDDTIFFQAYLGLSRRMKSTDTAVEETRGQTITYGGRPVEAFFSADSGGHTELAENVWGEEHPYCPSVPEAYDLRWIDSEWSHSAPLSDVEQRLKKAQLIPEDSSLRDLSIPASAVNKSGRAMQVFIRLADNSTRDVAGTAFQRALRLRSNLLQLQVTRPSPSAAAHILITGKGFGHGVGMNQWGARVLASRMGWDHKKILHFYFHSVEIH